MNGLLATGTNLPAQIELYAEKGNAYKFLFIAKGGGSANKTYLYQQTKALLNEASLLKFVEDNIKTIGTSACPPYHLAFVIGGTSAEFNLKTVKLASCRYLDHLPTTGRSSSSACERERERESIGSLDVERWLMCLESNRKRAWSSVPRYGARAKGTGDLAAHRYWRTVWVRIALMHHGQNGQRQSAIST